MKKNLFAGILCFFITIAAQAQTDSAKFTQCIGVQANELVRQVLNFSNSTASINNPYLLTYHVTANKCGWGLRIGAGYNYSNATTNDGITQTVSNLNGLSLRIGIEKVFRFSHKWSAGVGTDFVYGLNNDKTTTQVNDFDTATTISNTKRTIVGGGVMGWVRYAISHNILIGTESSFYYTSNKTTGSIDETTIVNPGGIAQRTVHQVTTDLSNKGAQGTLSVPVALYLVVRF